MIVAALGVAAGAVMGYALNEWNNNEEKKKKEK